MAFVLLIKKHLNPLSATALAVISYSIWLFVFPGPEGWGYLASVMLFFVFGVSSIIINQFIIIFINHKKKRFITQLFFALLFFLIFIYIWVSSNFY